MAPLFDAYDVHYSGSTDAVEVYEGKVDQKWSIGRLVPFHPTKPTTPTFTHFIPVSCSEVRNFHANKIGGVLILAICPDSPGYAFGLIIEACTKHQEKHKPTQVDPVQLSSHYLAGPALVPYEIRIRTLKSGRSYTNLYAEFHQEGRLRVTALALFGDLTVTPERSHGYHVEIPSPCARRIPLFTHPALIEKPAPGSDILEKMVNFSDELQIIADPIWPPPNAPEIRETLIERPANGDLSEKVGGGGLDEGQWVELAPSVRGPDHNILRPSFWPVISDMTHGYPMLLGAPAHWNPTMTWTVTFHGKIPPRSKDRSDRTTGIYAHAKSMVDPDGRQFLVSEWWTAPCDVSQGNVQEGWREKQVWLASSQQIAIVVPVEVEQKKTQRWSKL